MEIKKVSILIVTVFLFVSKLSGQRCLFGLPSDSTDLNHAEVIIINLPPTSNGRFQPSNEFESMMMFYKSHKELQFQAEIHFYYDWSGSEKYSSKLLDDFKEVLKDLEINNVEPIFVGEERPIYNLLPDRIRHSLYNSRIEIRVLESE